MADAAHLVAVRAIVADHLGAFVRDVLGDGGQEVGGAEDLKVAVDLGIACSMRVLSSSLLRHPERTSSGRKMSGIVSWLTAPACQATTTAVMLMAVMPAVQQSVFSSRVAWSVVMSLRRASVEIHQ